MIIHNAWRLDFNLSLASFEPHIRGTRNLIDISLSSAHAVRFMFTSSVASAQGWDPIRGVFPEVVQLDAGVAVGGGYGEGKYVAERVSLGYLSLSFRICFRAQCYVDRWLAIFSKIDPRKEWSSSVLV